MQDSGRTVGGSSLRAPCCAAASRSALLRLQDFANTQAGAREWTKDKSPEAKKEERNKRRAELGESLLSVGNDVPFKFPPTFTFVFRAFTSLDGIGKVPRAPPRRPLWLTFPEYLAVVKRMDFWSSPFNAPSSLCFWSSLFNAPSSRSPGARHRLRPHEADGAVPPPPIGAQVRLGDARAGRRVRGEVRAQLQGHLLRREGAQEHGLRSSRPPRRPATNRTHISPQHR